MSESTIPMLDAFQAGRIAGARGDSRHANPYKTDCDEYSQWDAGFVKGVPANPTAMRCQYCGRYARTSQQKYCGAGNDKDDTHRWRPANAVDCTFPAEPPQIGGEYTIIETAPPEPMPFDVALAFVRARIGWRSVEQRAAEALLRHIDATPHRPVEAWVADLRALSEDDRKKVFGAFCVYCGGDDPRCQCMNDE